MILEDIKYLLKFPPKVILQRIWNKGLQQIANRAIKREIVEEDQRLDKQLSIPYTYLQSNNLNVGGLDEKVSIYLIEKYLDHRFDLLGSGWVKMDYSAIAPGLETFKYNRNLEIKHFDETGNWLSQVVAPAHIAISKKYWQSILTTNSAYQPIDWQKDFKSGFRWDAQQWYKKQRALPGEKLGIDIKVPWELSRLQHLPQMAIFAQYLPAYATQLTKEFKCQILDFFASNPLGMGVNYQCAMDVGIRAANLCVAYDLFSKIDTTKKIIDKDFEQLFATNLFLHGKHILTELEYKEGIPNNHYLGNIAGLLFIASYLPINVETTQWLAFSIQELIHSLNTQYYEDGGNFESSTAYHRLSSEMIFFSTALAIGLGAEKRKALQSYDAINWKEKAPLLTPEKQIFDTNNPYLFPNNYFEKLYQVGLFAKNIRKENGEIPQFGDNDSGRFFRLSPNGCMMTTTDAVNKYQNLKNYGKQYSDSQFWEENDLNTDTFLSLAAGLFQATDFQTMKELFPLEASMIKALAQKQIPITQNQIRTKATGKRKKVTSLSKENYPYQITTKLGEKEHEDLAPFTKELKLKIFPDFQLYIFKSERIYLAIGGVSSKQQHPSGSHVHNDSLSIELAIDGKDLIVDPGTYLYTPIPARRVLFKSTAVHNTLIVEGEEQNPSLKGKIGLFSVNHDTNISLIDYDENSITIGLIYRHVQQVRKVTIEDQAIVIADYSNVPFKQHFNRFELYSNGYGKRIH